MNKLREVFSTEVSDTARQRISTMIERAFAEKWCSTCKHYIPADPHTPGFITDGPDCILTGKVAMETCQRYERDENKFLKFSSRWLKCGI